MAGENGMQYLKIGDVAERFGVSDRTIYRWIDNRGFPQPIWLGCNKWRVSEIDAWERSL
jgi:excisionase family DNA binding protein